VSFLQAFGSYLPSRVVGNAEIGAMAGVTAEWILNVSGIEERRFAAEGESVAVRLQAEASAEAEQRRTERLFNAVMVAIASISRTRSRAFWRSTAIRQRSN